LKYDVTDLRSRLIAFANNSTNQAKVALKVVQNMKFTSDPDIGSDALVKVRDDRLVIFDIEVYPNLFVICWKFRGSDQVVKMINPTMEEVQSPWGSSWSGSTTGGTTTTILYAASLGFKIPQLYDLTRKIVIDGNRNAFFAQAYNLSFADIWDLSTVKQSLKKFEIDLGIHHMELDLPLDQPVEEKDWPKVVEYCENDVKATEAVLEAQWGDYVARQILAELSGLSMNDTTQRHTAKILFGDDKNPQQHFVYTDLSEMFQWIYV
jgi:hypothetical protein